MTDSERAEQHRRAAEHHRKIAEVYRELGDSAMRRSIKNAYYRIADGHTRLAALEDEAAFAAQASYRRLIDLNR